MTWLATKTFLKKIYTFLKIYWYIPVILIWTLVLWMFWKRSSRDITGLMYGAEKSFREQLRVIDELHEEEIKKRDEILKQYQRTIDQLENDRRLRSEEISRDEKKEIKKLVEKYYHDKSEYTKIIADRFGFEHVQ